jgi:DUF4097 and DUF4098 domain-containing protein YvlB
MKSYLAILFLGSVLAVQGQKFKDERVINETIPLTGSSDTWIVIHNINGNVQVTTSSSDEIEVDLRLTIAADYKDDFEDGKRELGMQHFQRDDKLYITMDAPFIREHQSEEGEWFGFSCMEDVDYEYWYDYQIRVPEHVNIKASTVNDGDVFISGVKGHIKASNVNGHIDIENAQNVRYANTVNGNINVTFDENPDADGKYHTINGDIILMLNSELNAKVYSKSMNGEIYSAFDFRYLEPTLEINQSDSKRGTRYRLGQHTGVEIGKNGPDIRMETLNGNMYLKKI